jgi:hypothetical protein
MIIINNVNKVLVITNQMQLDTYKRLRLPVARNRFMLESLNKYAILN